MNLTMSELLNSNGMELREWLRGSTNVDELLFKKNFLKVKISELPIENQINNTKLLINYALLNKIASGTYLPIKLRVVAVHRIINRQ